MKECRACAPFNERDSTVYRTIGSMIHDSLGLIKTYPEHHHVEVERLLKRVLRAWHSVPVKKRLTHRERLLTGVKK